MKCNKKDGDEVSCCLSTHTHKCHMGFYSERSSLNLPQMTSLAVGNETKQALLCRVPGEELPHKLKAKRWCAELPFLFNWRYNGLWIQLKLLKKYVESQNQMFTSGTFSKVWIWAPDWDLSLCLFVFVVIFWLEPFTAIFEPKILNSPRFFKLVLCSTTGGQHVQMFLTHCRTFMSYLKPSSTD